jgi:hypothetical protein
LLTAKVIGPRGLLPGAIAGAVAFTALITIGTGLVTHQLKNTSATYGAFGAVIGIVAFLLLLAKLNLYAAELNPVLARRLYPLALPLGGEPTDADRRVLAYLVHAEQRRDDQAIGVGFGDHAADQAASDATRHARADSQADPSSQRQASQSRAAGAPPAAELARTRACSRTSSRPSAESSRPGSRHRANVSHGDLDLGVAQPFRQRCKGGGTDDMAALDCDELPRGGPLDENTTRISFACSITWTRSGWRMSWTAGGPPGSAASSCGPPPALRKRHRTVLGSGGTVAG